MSHDSVPFEPDQHFPERAAYAQLDVDLESHDPCAGPTGRVFAVAVDPDLDLGELDLLKLDPFEGGGPPLLGLMAVPVLVDSGGPSPEVTSTPPLRPDTSPHPPTTPPSTYVDEQFGWSVDVPAGWESHPFHVGAQVQSRGVYFTSGGFAFIPGLLDPPDNPIPDDGEAIVFIWTEEDDMHPLADDFFPLLTFATLEPGGTDTLNFEMTGSFRANGRPYSILVKGSKNAVFEAAEAIGALLESIEFPGWEPGETRDGFIALWDLEDSVTWLNLGGRIYLAFGPDPGQIYGPIPTCGEGQNMTEDDQGNAILECPDGSTIGYDRHGLPFDTNPEPNAVPCELNPVIRAWDGSLLAILDSKVISVA